MLVCTIGNYKLVNLHAYTLYTKPYTLFDQYTSQCYNWYVQVFQASFCETLNSLAHKAWYPMYRTTKDFYKR